MPLRESIVQIIQQEGPLSFHDFMELTRCHPCEDGVQSPPANQSHEHEEHELLVGQLLARQLEEMWKLLDKPSFTIVEYGAGRGTLCRSLFRCLENNPLLRNNFHYCVVAHNGDAQRHRDFVCDQAEWFGSIDDVPYEIDCILSNEVVNHLSVHEVVMQQELMEIFIDHNDGFVEIVRPAPAALKDYLHEMNIQLPRGYRTEINLDALQWLRKNAETLRRGFLLTIGNGLPAHEFFSLSRHRGNLECDDAEQANVLYDQIGNNSIRSKVNFTALHHWGRMFGLECCGFTSHAHFLHGLGLLPALDNLHADAAACKDKIIQLYRKIMRFSSRFNILVQQKGLANPILSGLQFAKKYV